MLRAFIIAALASALALNVALAQRIAPDAPEEATAPKLDPKACADRDRQSLGDTHESQGTAPRENLSDKLARTEGVICPPPEIDPDIRLPTPNAGRMPVIPPPGSPGGDPNVRPK